MNIEPLESRIAPASTVFFVDANEDVIRFTSSLGDLTGHIIDTAGTDGLHNIFNVDLSDPSFNHTNFSATVTKVRGSDGLLIVGHIRAGVNDLGSVSLPGDLGDIDAGSGSATVPAIKSLTVGSLGRFAKRGDGNAVSDISGGVSSLVVKGDLIDTWFRVNGKLTSGFVGGSVVGGDASNSGEIYAFMLGKLTVKGDLVGGKGESSGAVEITQGAGSIAVGGSVRGGFGDRSGGIYGALNAESAIAKVSIGGSLLGGAGTFSGAIGGNAAHGVTLGSVTIGRDLVGGSGVGAGLVGSARDTLTKVVVTGSLLGGSNTASGQIYGDKVGTVVIGHEVRGGSGDYSGVIGSGQNLGSVAVGGSVGGGAGDHSGSVFAAFSATGKIDKLSIGGSLLGGHGALSGILGDSGTGHIVSLGVVTIGQDIVGLDGPSSGFVFAYQGTLDQLTVKGSVYGGTNSAAGSIVAQGHAGAIAIGGSLYGGSGGGSGSIHGSQGVDVLSIGGSLFGASGPGSANIDFANRPISLLKVGHDIRGGSGAFSASVIGTVTKAIVGGQIIPGTGSSSGHIG